MTEAQTSTLRYSIGEALSEMTDEQKRNLVVGPYLEIRETINRIDDK